MRGTIVYTGRTRPSRQLAPSAWCWGIPAALYLCASLALPSAASAQSSDYCNKVRARGAGRAALLIAPRLFSDVLRYPSSVAAGPASLDNLQVRVGMSFSPVDALRGARVDAEADADCRAHELQIQLETALEAGADAYALRALEAQLDYLEKHRADWQALLAGAEQRLAARLITTLEYGEFSKLVAGLEREVEELRGRAELIRARLFGKPPQPLDPKQREYLSAALEHERRAASSMSLDAWDVSLSGGVIPTTEDAPEWFGWVQLSYSLGGFFSGGHEDDHLSAREAELKNARYEVPARIEALKRELLARRAHAERELALVDRQLTFLLNTRAALAHTDVAASVHTRDSLALEQLIAESEQRFLRVLIDTLTTIQGGKNG
jgi:hypothetical protein